jgi:hypothetical protein
MSDVFDLPGMSTAGDRATIHGVQSVGRMAALFRHTNLSDLGVIPADGVYLTGFKLESLFLDGDQLIDNSKIVALLNGDTITLTNSNMSGTLTFNATRSAGTMADGDVVKLSQYLVQIGDSIGGTLVVRYVLNDIEVTVTFYKCTVKRVPPLKLAGNDVPDYSVQWNYAYYQIVGDR